ncbi:MAG: metal-dependent hydrolase [Nevskia sp.]
MLPTRRDLHFRLSPASAGPWHVRGACVTHFANAMSISFPEGERFFIHTVRHYRERIRDPELEQAVIAFIGQEAMHSREHADYNRLLAEAGLPAAALEEHARKFFTLLKRLPAPAQLAVTIAQEHFTAIVAELLLTDPRIIAGADAHLRALWRWHALEETEHKAVAFDVYRSVMGSGAKAYALRASGLLLTTVGFFALLLYYQRRLMQGDPVPSRWRERAAFVDFLFRSPALLPRLALPWLRYLRPGFHPWEQDNRHLLDEMAALVAETRAFGAAGYGEPPPSKRPRAARRKRAAQRASAS